MDDSLISPADGSASARPGRAAVGVEIVKRVAALARAEMGAGQTWADLGGGAGALAEVLHEAAADMRLVSLDLAFPPLRRAVRAGRAAHAVNADIDRLPFRAGSLHGAIAVSVLQWSASPEEALRGAADALKPDGALCFAAYVDGRDRALRPRAALPRRRLGAG